MAMQRRIAHVLVVIWPFKGQAEFFRITVTFVIFAGATNLGSGACTPAKAPADRNATARAVESEIVLMVFMA